MKISCFLVKSIRVIASHVSLALTILVLSACAAEGTASPLISPIITQASLTPSTIQNTPSPAQTATPAATNTPIPSFQVTLDAVGDIMLARSVGEQVLAHGPQIVFAGVQSVLDSADLLVGNLECVITERNTPEKKSYPFKAPPITAQALSLAKFDVLSLANNHAMDFGYAGLIDTQAYLGQYGIATLGAGLDAHAAHAPLILERNGLRLAFLAYVDVLPENSGFDARTWIATNTHPGIAWANPAQIQSDVIAAKRQADLVIVLLHGGIEITSVINNISSEQRLEAHSAIDAGAALVIGSHPHVLQQIEKYHGGLIAYSLGNFVFDQYDGIANATIILHLVLNRDGVQKFDYVPVLIDNGLPHEISNDLVPAIGTLVAPPNP